MLKAVLAAGVIAAVSPLALATPVSAAANPAIVHFDTTYGASGWSCTSSSTSVRANPGDPLTLSWSSTQPSTTSFVFAGPSGDTYVPMSTQSPSVVRFTQLGTYQLNSAFAFNCVLSVSVVSEPVPPAQAHDYFQQVGLPASGNCADVSPTTGHWRGFPLGGWSRSWASWINGGRGGPVCTREIEERPDGTIAIIG